MLGLGLLAATAATATPAGATPAGVTTTITTPGETAYAVPTGTYALQVTLDGAAGSGGYLAPQAPVGSGAAVTTTLPVAPGTSTLYVEVGALNGGGGSTYAGAGGGASDIQTCAAGGACAYTGVPSSDPRLVVAGGGGGAGETYPSTGGAGGNAGTSAAVTGPGAGGNGTDSGAGGNGGDAGFGDTATAASGGSGSGSCGGSGGQGAPGGGGGGEYGGGYGGGGGGGAGWVGGSGGGTGDCTLGGSGAGGGGGAGASFVEGTASGTSIASAGTSTAAEVVITAFQSFTSAARTTFTVGTAGSFQVTTALSPTPSLSETGALPSGVTFVDNSDGTATLAGTPAVGSGGTYPFTITAANGTNYTQNFVLTVDQPPIITSGAATTFTVGSAGTFTVTATGPPPPAITETGNLPSGVSFTDNGNGTATLSGTPAVGSGGTYPFVVLAQNGLSPSAAQNFTLTVNEAPAITSDPGTTFKVGVLGSFPITATGFPSGHSMTVSEVGALPAGVSLVQNSNGTWKLSGTPAPLTGGSYLLALTASNGIGTAANQSFTLLVDQAPVITSAASAAFVLGTSSTFQVTTNGYPASELFETGSLPGGVTFADNGDGTATIAGTPVSGTAGSYPLTITAANGITPHATQSFVLSIYAITSAAATTFNVGTAGTFQVTTAGFPPNPSVTITSGSLPSGVSFTDNGDGTATLAGTPASGSGGVYPFTITATTGSAPVVTQSFTLTVGEAASITSADATTFTTGSAGSFTVTTYGFPYPSLSIPAGSLPSGVTFTDNGDGTATLAGTPADGTGGTYPFAITASNGTSPDATQSFTLTVDQAPMITSADNTTFTTGSSGTFSVTTTGFPSGPTLTITELGDLPSGVTFTDNTDGTATLAGTPADGTGGTWPFTITATNGTTPDAIQSFTLTVTQAPAITSADNTTFTTGSSGTFSVTTTGYPTNPSLSIPAGSLPSGVAFTDNGDGTATLAGTPADGTGGTYPFTITASNGTSPDATQSFTLTVDQAPMITSADNTTFSLGVAGTFSVTTSGFPTNPTLMVSTGTLPTGVTFTDNGDGTATLAGTPADGTGGTWPFTITAYNGASPAAVQSFTLTVDQAPAITSAASTTFIAGSPGTFTVTTSGVPTDASLSIPAGSLPSGVTFTDNGDGTATLAGTPASGSGGTYPFTITASNGTSPDATQSFTLTVDQAPAITSAAATTFTIGSDGSFSVTTSGYPTNPSLSIPDGSLPSGVTFTDNGDGTATLAGTPALGTAGTYPFVITAHDSGTTDANQSFVLTVRPVITSAASTTFTTGSAGTFTVTTSASASEPPLALSETGSLPSGVTFTDNGDGTATLAGTPASGTGGTYPLTITGGDGILLNATQSFILTVDQAPAITSAAAATFTIGSSGTFSVTSTGFPVNPSLSIPVGSLPGGVTFTDNHNGTATLAGTPASGTAGTYPFTITAHNGVTPDATQSFTLTVSQAASVPADVAAVTEGPAGVVDIAGAGLSAGWHSLGGATISAPAVAAIPSATTGHPSTPLIVAVGTNHELYVRTLSLAWRVLGASYCLDSPAATFVGSTLYIACEGNGNSLYVATTTMPSSGLPTVGGFVNLGGTLSAGPAMAMWNHTLTFFVTNATHALLTRTLSAGYVTQPDSCVGHPAAGLDPVSGVTYVACQGLNQHMWVANSTSGLASAADEGGLLVNGPGVAATNTGPVFLAEGILQNSSPVHQAWMRTIGSGWQAVGGSLQNGVNGVGLDYFAGP